MKSIMYLHLKNPVNWLRGILYCIMALAIFVIVTNGFAQMYDYTRLYLDADVRGFLGIGDRAVGVLAFTVLLLAIALLLVADYCVWVSFDEWAPKIVVIGVAIAVNIFWWNYNQNSFERKREEQAVVKHTPKLREETSIHDERIAELKALLANNQEQVRELEKNRSSRPSWARHYTETEAVTMRDLGEERKRINAELSTLNEKRLAELAPIRAHNRAELDRVDAKIEEAAEGGRQLGRGIEIFLFILSAIIHQLSPVRQELVLGKQSVEKIITERRDKVLKLEDGTPDKITARTTSMVALPDHTSLGVTEKRYAKFADALPELMTIARNGGAGLNQFVARYCATHPEVKPGTLKDFYVQAVKPFVAAPEAEAEELEDTPPPRTNFVEDLRNRTVEWVKSVKPVGEQARDIFDRA